MHMRGGDADATEKLTMMMPSQSCQKLPRFMSSCTTGQHISVRHIVSYFFHQGAQVIKADDNWHALH